MNSMTATGNPWIVLSGALLVALLSGICHAQIFPELDIEEIRRRADQAGPPRDPDPGRQPDTPRDQHPSASPFEVFSKELSGIRGEESRVLESSRKHTMEVAPSVRAYIEGVYLLRMGRYMHARQQLSAMARQSFRSEPADLGDNARILFDEIKSGRPHLYLALAMAMEAWSDFDSEERLISSWNQVIRVVERGPLAELTRAHERGQLQDGEETLRLADSLRINGLAHWRSLWLAERGVRERENDPAAWLDLITRLGPHDATWPEEFTPNYLRQRAALKVFRQFWPQHDFVTSGRFNVALGLNHVGVGQLDDYQAHFQIRPDHAPQAGERLRAGLKLAETAAGTVNEWKRN